MNIAAPIRFDVPVLRWFGPPVLAGSEDTRRAHSLWMVSWPFLLVVIVLLSALVAVEPETLTRRAVTMASVGILVAGLHELSRRGRPVLASWILVIGLTLVVTQRAWNTGGIHAPVAVFYTIFVIMGGALIGARGGVVTALVALGGALFLTAAELVGWLLPRPGEGPAIASFVFVVLTLGLTLVVQKLLISRPPRGQRLSDDLVPMFVHDMKSPITVMLAQLDMMRKEVRGEMAANVDEAIGGARTLDQLTTNLLDVSRIEAQRMPVHITSTDLTDLARGVVSGFAVLQFDRDMTVTAKTQVIAQCDAELMRRVMENLVSNAIKHTPPDSAVRVHVKGVAGGVRVAVEDKGPGIAEESRGRIFEKFNSRTIRTESGYHSTGLGLAFCKLAVEAQGGTIRVESAQPHGSIFIVDLPNPA
jgi:signal transduction histidine kinase